MKAGKSDKEKGPPTNMIGNFFRHLSRDPVTARDPGRETAGAPTWAKTSRGEYSAFNRYLPRTNLVPR